MARAFDYEVEAMINKILDNRDSDGPTKRMAMRWARENWRKNNPEPERTKEPDATLGQGF